VGSLSDLVLAPASQGLLGLVQHPPQLVALDAAGDVPLQGRGRSADEFAEVDRLAGFAGQALHVLPRDPGQGHLLSGALTKVHQSIPEVIATLVQPKEASFDQHARQPMNRALGEPGASREICKRAGPLGNSVEDLERLVHRLAHATVPSARRVDGMSSKYGTAFHILTIVAALPILL
jgi:predicted RNA-binding Zn ribbon-like protein